MSEVGWDTGDDFKAGGKYLDQPGWYHVVVTAATSPALKKDGVPIDNSFLGVALEVLAPPAAKGKLSDITIFHPRPTHKDGGAFSRKVGDRFLLAVNVIKPDSQNKKVNFSPAQLVGQQMIVHLGKDAGEKYLSLIGADVFHVDDAEVVNHPKDVASLALIPPQWRRVASKPAPPAPAAPPAPIDASTL